MIITIYLRGLNQQAGSQTCLLQICRSNSSVVNETRVTQQLLNLKKTKGIIIRRETDYIARCRSQPALSATGAS